MNRVYLSIRAGLAPEAHVLHPAQLSISPFRSDWAPASASQIHAPCIPCPPRTTSSQSHVCPSWWLPPFYLDTVNINCNIPYHQRENKLSVVSTWDQNCSDFRAFFPFFWYLEMFAKTLIEHPKSKNTNRNCPQIQKLWKIIG